MGKADEDVASGINERNLEDIRVLVGFPSGVNLLAPDSDDRAHFCPDDYIVFYEYPFKNGFKFPFTLLTRQIMEVFDVSPRQLMPLVWRVCGVIERATSDWEEVVTLGDLY